MLTYHSNNILNSDYSMLTCDAIDKIYIIKFEFIHNVLMNVSAACVDVYVCTVIA